MIVAQYGGEHGAEMMRVLVDAERTATSRTRTGGPR